MKLTFLGTGTSTGVPQIGCDCEVCRSTDPRDKRLRCSALLQTADGRGILIDCGPDFRTQILEAGSPSVDAVLLSHIHYDHVGGIDDLRPYSYREGGLPVYCRRDVAQTLRANMPYAFLDNPKAGVPHLHVREIRELVPETVCGVEFMPLAVSHGSLDILGFRFGNLAYITDCKTMPQETLDRLRGVDTLVINALRRIDHLTHMNLQEALRVIKMTAPRRAYLTHLSHQMGRHAEVEPTLPPGVAIAYDRLSVEIPEN